MPEPDMADERKEEISLDPQSTENINFNQSMDENDMNFNQMNFSEVKELPLEWLDRLMPYTEPMKSMTWRQQFSRVFFVDDHGVLRPFDLERAQAGEMSHFRQLSGLPYNVGEILQQFTSLPLSLIYHYTGMGVYLRALFDSQRLVDTLIHVEDRVFAAHRVVLACHSTYFAQVFLSSKHPSPKMAELRVKNIDPNMFYTVLSFLYTGQLYVNQNNVDHLLNVAHQLHVPAVLFKCLDFLDHIPPNKTIDMVTEPKAVVDEAYRLMEAPLREIIHTTTFLTTSIEALEVALGQDDLPVSAESEVFSAALQWLQFDLESREKYLERLMQQVRFAYMRPGEVIQAAQSSPLLKSSAYCRDRIMEAIWLMTLRGYQADDFLECDSCKPRNYLDSDEGVPQDYENWGHARYDNLLEPAVSQPFQKQPSLTRQPSLRRNSSQSLASARQMQRRRSSHSVETARLTKRRRSSDIMPLAQLSARSLQQPASLLSVSQQPSTRSSHTLPVYQPSPSTLLQKQPSYLQPSQLHTDLSLGGQSESADYSFPVKALMSPRSSTISAREIPSVKLLQRQNSNVQTSNQQSSSNGSLPRRVASLRQTSSRVLPQESHSYSLLQEKLSSISRQDCSGALGHPQASFNEETQQLGQPLVPLYQRESSSALVHKKASERVLQKQPSMTQPPQQPSTVSVQRQPSYHAPLPQQQMPREVPQVAGPSAPPVIEIISSPSSIRSITKHLSKTQPSEQQIASKNSHPRGTQSAGILLKKDHSHTGVSLKQTQSGTVPQREVSFTSLKQASAGGLLQKEPSFVSLQQKEPSFVSLQQKEPSFVSLQQKSSSVFTQQRTVQPPTAPQVQQHPSVSFQQPASLPPRSPPRTPPSQQPSPRPRQKEPPPRPLKREPSVTQHREPSPRPQSGPLPQSPVPEAPAPPSPTEEASDVEMPFFRVCRSRFLDEEVQGRVIEVEVGFSRSNHSATARTDRRHRSRSRSRERHPADGYGTGDESDAFPAGLLAIGGFVEDGDPTGKCHSHMLDAGDQKWLKMSEMPQTRLHFAAAFVREKLYVTGGYDPSIFADETESHATKTTFQYSPRKERWRRVADMRSARAFHTVSVLSGRLYALGGQDEREEVLKSAEVYNPAEDRWAPLPPMMDGRVGAASAPLTLSLSGEGEGEVMVVGGYGEGGEGDPTDIPCCPVLMSTEIFDPDTERWKYGSNLRVPRAQCTLVVVGSNLYLCGGVTRHICTGLLCSTAEVDIYDPYEDQWTNVTNLTIARHNAGAAAFDGKLYVVGGVTTYVEGVLRSVECYDMDTGKWDSSLPLLPLGAKSVACVTIAKDI